MPESPPQPSARNAREMIEIIGPALRALLARGPELAVAVFDDAPAVVAFANNANTEIQPLAGNVKSASTEQGCAPVVSFSPPAAASRDTVIEALREVIARHKTTSCDAPRLVVFVQGVGLFAVGETYASAVLMRDALRAAIELLAGRATSLDELAHIASSCRRTIEQRLPQAAQHEMTIAANGGRVRGKIAVITGAAQGFGLEIAQAFAAEGGTVVLADINAAGSQAAAASICQTTGPGRALGLPIDVAHAESISACFHEVIRTYGGFDMLISNAGVLRAESVKTQSERDFDLVTTVNYKGYFLCVQKAAAILAVQHKARPDYMSDIIQINSKSGLQGSNRNGAYAGSKFGGIGLTQSFALELIEDGIKVNAICPGNFFDGPLWSDPVNGLFAQYLRTAKVPGAKTVADVKRFYEAKVPMGRGCTTADVMKALYYLIDQHYETGQAVPVTGGQVMLS